MSTAIVPASHETVCGKCGGRLSCDAGCENDMISLAKRTVREVMEGRGGRGAQARLSAATIVLEKDYLEHLTDEDLLAEVRRRAGARK